MADNFFDTGFIEDLDRVDGIAKVTGRAKYSAEYDINDLAYGVLVGSTIAKGIISAMDTGAAERAPGVLAVITHLNCPHTLSRPLVLLSRRLQKPPVTASSRSVLLHLTPLSRVYVPLRPKRFSLPA